MILRHSLLQRNLAENFLLLVLVSSHTCLYLISREKQVSFSATSSAVRFHGSFNVDSQRNGDAKM